MASAILCGLWLLLSSVIFVYGLVYSWGFSLPQTCNDALLFGKVKAKNRKWTIFHFIEIPKRWFAHFYVWGLVVNGYMLYVVLCAYMLGQQPKWWLLVTLHYATESFKSVSTDAASAVLLIGFMMLQNLRRLLECYLVSVYSNSTMNLIHYAFGMALYTLYPVCVLSEAPSLLIARIDDWQGEYLRWRHILGGLLFVWASYQQHRIHQAFATLRKNKKGEVATLQHKIPKGGWFEYVSCPHYTMEILIYMAFLIISGFTHLTFWTVFIFVLTNQGVAGYLTHLWYRTTYKTYPKHRKALIPYLF